MDGVSVGFNADRALVANAARAEHRWLPEQGGRLQRADYGRQWRIV